MHCLYTSKAGSSTFPIFNSFTSKFLTMRKHYSYARIVIGLFGILIMSGLSAGRLDAQCNTAPSAGPINLTINMSGSSAIINSAAVNTVLTAVNDGIAPCNIGCILYYSLTPGGPYISLLLNPLVVSCASPPGGSWPFTMYFIAQRPLFPGCASNEIELVVNLNDVQPPTILCPPDQVVNTAPGVCYNTIPGLIFTDVSSANAAAPLQYGDNCGTPAISYNITGATTASGPGGDLSPIQFQEGVSTVTMTVNDGSNPDVTCSFSVTVNDNEVPTWVPEPTTITQWLVDTLGLSAASTVITSITYGGPGTNRLTVTLNCDSPDYPTAFAYFSTQYIPTAQDNCDPNPTEIFNDQFDVLPWVCPTVTHIRRRWRASDFNGNVIPVPGPTAPLAKLDLIVQNTIAPVFTTAPIDVTIAANDPMVCGIDLTGTTHIEVIASSDCSGAPTYSWVINTYPITFGGALAGVGNNATQFYVPGLYNITYVATDFCGNNDSHSFNFEIIDVVPPTVMCPPNQSLSAVLDNCFQNAIWNEATYMDNCPGTLSLDLVGIDPNGNNISILTFQGGGCMDQAGFDGAFAPGNWTSAPPAGVNWVGAPASLSIVSSTTNVTIPITDAGIVLFNYSYVPSAGASTDDFGYTVNGNFFPLVLGSLGFAPIVGSASFAVNPGDVIGFRLATQGIFPNNASVVITGFNYFCGASNNVSFASFPVGVSTMTYTVTDAANNTTTCTFTVTVTDDQDPVITCGGNQTIFTICPTAPLPNYTSNWSSISENCPGYTITQSPPAGTTLGAIFAPGVPVHGGTFMVTLTITDKGGNMDDCSFMVTLEDQDLPIPSVDPLPPVNPMTTLFTDCGTYQVCSPTAVKCNGDIIYGTTTLFGAVFNPNLCGPGMPGYTILNPSFNAILWTYDDGLGNIVTQSQQIDIYVDLTPPTLTCPPNVAVFTDPGLCTATNIAGISMSEIIPTIPPYLDPADYPNPGEYIDNCGVTMFGWSSTSGSAANTNNAGTGIYNLGINTVTYTAQDAAGNTGTCTFTITVTDNEDPTFTCSVAPVLDSGAPGDGIPGDCAYTLGNLDTSLDPMGVSDNCPGPYTITYNVVSVFGTGTFTPGPNPSSLAGSTFTIDPVFGDDWYTITWTVEDANGNDATCNYLLIVRDGEAPTVTCPAGPLVRTTSQDGMPPPPGDCFYTASGNEFDPTGMNDNCSIVSVSNDFNFSNTLDNEYFPKGNTLVTWTVSDAWGNTGTCTLTVIVNDDEPPLNLYCPGNIVLPNIGGDCNNFVSWIRPLENDWIDNCDPSNMLTITEVISDPGVQAAIDLSFLYNQSSGPLVPFTVFPGGITTITYTATDQSNNSSTCSFTVTIEDIEAPTITCPPDLTLGTTCLAGTVPDYITLANVSDNCPASVLVSQLPLPGTTLATVFSPNPPMNGDMFIVTLTATDQNPQGLSSDCTFKVTLQETNLPQPNMASLPSILDSCGFFDVAAPTANDCGNTVYGVPNVGVLIQAFPPVYRYFTGIYNVIWTYVGASGNTFQAQFIEIQDDTTPPNTLCQSVNVNLSAFFPGQVTVLASQFNNGSTDYCGIVAVEYSVEGGPYVTMNTFDCSDEGVNNVTLRVTDVSGNQNTCNTTLTINDITNPTIVGGCPSDLSFPTSNNGGYDCNGQATFTAPAVTDNCTITTYQATLTLPGGSMIVFDLLGNPNVNTSLPKGVTDVNLLVIDEHGNSSTCNFEITITDDENPFVNCVNNQSRNNDPTVCQYQTVGTEFDPVNFGDNCPGAFVYNNYNGLSSLNGAIFPVGTTHVTWTVQDAVGHTATCSFAITIIDNEPPVINFCQTDIIQNATAGTCNALVSWSPTFGFDVDDNCGILNIVQDISDPTVVPVYPYQPFGPDFPPFLLNNALFPIGTTTVSYTVHDIHGNSSICSFTVDVLDIEAPSITCPPNQILNTVCASGTVPNYVGLIANLTDNCVANLIVTQDPPAGTLLSSIPGLTPADGESFTVTITAADPNPNFLSASCNFLVTLNDINLPIPDVAVLPNLFGPCEGLVVNPPTATDCGTTIYGIPDKGIQISFSPPQYLFTSGLYTVIWTYVGTNGSVQQVQQIQVIDDIIPPTMNCQNATVILDVNGNGTLSVNQVNAGITDNCGLASITVSPAAYNCSNVGTNNAVVTALDIHGNSNTCNVTITVIDNIAPAFNIINQNLTVNCGNIPTVPNVLATDACGVANVTFTEVSTQGGNANNCNFYNYVITRTWTATDVNANVATVQQIINVHDISAPTWTIFMPTTIVVGTNPFTCNGNVTLVVNGTMVTDNCAGFNNLSISYTGTANGNGTTNASGVYPLGTTVLTFTAIDPCGNVSQHIVNIIVEDTTPPTPVCVNSITLPLNSMGQLVIPPHVVDNGSFDNCSAVTLSINPDTFTCADAGQTHIVVLTATDAAGNSATCPANVTIIDNTPPILISCPPDLTLDCTSSLDPAFTGTPIFSDSCGLILTFSNSIQQVGGAICYIVNRTWVANDGYGNITTCLQKISIFDAQPPSFTSAMPANVTIQCTDAVPVQPNVTAQDNCGPANISFNQTSTKTSNNSCSDFAYTIVRTWTAQDGCSNSVQHTQIITVQDTLSPVFIGLPDSLLFYTNDFNADSCTVPIILKAVADDNCHPDSLLIYTNSSPYGNGADDASGSYPAGTYNITFFATDLCGNDLTQQVFIEVVDNSTPTAVCFTNINVSLNSQGNATITPQQIDDQSRDNCTLHPDLILEIDKQDFTCENLGQNIVQLTVTDEAGNQNTCTTIVVINAGPGNEINHTVAVTFESFPTAMDGAISIVASGGSGNFTYLWSPGGQTTPSISGLASGTYTLVITDTVTGCKKTVIVFVGITGVPDFKISGNIYTPTGAPVAQVQVNLTGSQVGQYITGVDGYYEFIVPAGSTVTVTPVKNINPSNGVTSLDFAIIQQHILAPPALKPLTTPYKLIAADENGNNQINGIDIAIFQNTILNNHPNFPNVTSWVFVEEGFVFPDPLQPWLTGWDASTTFINIGGNQANTDFIGVKMGDVTDDVNPANFTGVEEAETRSSRDMIVSIDAKQLTKGETIYVPIKANQFNDILAYQHSLSFDPSVLVFKGIESVGLPNMNMSNFNVNDVELGMIHHMWHHNTPITLNNDDILYTLLFEVIKDGKLEDAIQLADLHLGQVAYQSDKTPVKVELNFNSDNANIADAFMVVGNRPNPFTDYTLIEYTLPESGRVRISVTDLLGRAVTTFETNGVSGKNVEVIRSERLNGPGMYFYILEYSGNKAIGKMHFQD